MLIPSLALAATLIMEPCGRLIRRGPCEPPKTFVYAKALFPFNTKVRYGGVSTSPKGYWIWLKDEEFSRPCTTKEFERLSKWVKNPCLAAIGEPLYQTSPFRLIEKKEKKGTKKGTK